MKTYDCIVIGGGVVGTAVLDRLAFHDLATLLLEKDDDVSVGASRANSGIVHAGYDCKPGTLKAKFNVRGNHLMWSLVDDLDVPHLKCGSLVVADKDNKAGIDELYDKGVKNGVEVEVWDKQKTLSFEPNLSDNIEWSLYAKEAGIVSPYQLAIALADRAVLNGAEIHLEEGVTALERKDGLWVVTTEKSQYLAKTVVNCAGAYGADVNDLAGAEHYETSFRKGEYYVLDNTERQNVETVIFPLPTKAGKGILVAPTADGNVIYGPTSHLCDLDDTSVTLDGLQDIRTNVAKTYKNPVVRKCIRTYAGVRTIIGDDFVIGKSKVVDDFYMAIGICSPGLSSAPAIAEHLETLIAGDVALKDNVVTRLPRAKRLSEFDGDELNTLIKEDEAWGRIVCRCEKVSEAEIVKAIHSPLPAVTVDAVKRRVRAGMGRCQGGFCATRVMEIISRETGKDITEIRKGKKGSNIALYSVKEVPND